MRRYCHVGTGNYNSKTARLYEDLGLLSGRSRDRRRPDPAVQLPDRLRPRHASTSRLLVAPDGAARPPSPTSSRNEMEAVPGGGRIV